MGDLIFYAVVGFLALALFSAGVVFGLAWAAQEVQEIRRVFRGVNTELIQELRDLRVLQRPDTALDQLLREQEASACGNFHPDRNG